MVECMIILMSLTTGTVYAQYNSNAFPLVVSIFIQDLRPDPSSFVMR
jgi:hypothetical protein